MPITVCPLADTSFYEVLFWKLSGFVRFDYGIIANSRCVFGKPITLAPLLDRWQASTWYATCLKNMKRMKCYLVQFITIFPKADITFCLTRWTNVFVWSQTAIKTVYEPNIWNGPICLAVYPQRVGISSTSIASIHCLVLVQYSLQQSAMNYLISSSPSKCHVIVAVTVVEECYI